MFIFTRIGPITDTLLNVEYESDSSNYSVASEGHMHTNLHTVVYLLQARPVEPEKQPLLPNGSETTFVSRQLLGKHVPAVTDTHATIEVLSEMVFSALSVERG
jgi:hypothetical protein